MADVTSRAKLLITGEDKTGAAFGRIGGKLDKLMKIGAALGGVMAVRAAGRAIADRAKDMGDLADRAGRLNLAVKSVEELDYAFGQLGLGGKELTEKTFAMMAKQLGEVAGTDALKSIGLSLADIRGLRPEQQFFAIGKAIAALPDEVDRTRAQVDLFGRSATQLSPLFRAGAATFEESMSAIMAAAPTVGDELAGLGDRAADGMATLKKSWDDTFNVALGSAMGMLERHFGRLDVAVPMMWESVKWFGDTVGTRLGELSVFAGQIWDAMSADWGRTLEWMGRGIWEFVKASAAVLGQFGKNIWTLLTEGEWDSGAMSEKIKALGDALKPDFEKIGLQLKFSEIESLDERRKKLMASAEAQQRLLEASKGIPLEEIDETARRAVDAVKEAAGYVDAGSYDAFAAVMKQNNGGAASVAGAVVRAAGVSGGMSGSTPGAAGGSMVTELKQILAELKAQTTIWRTIGVTA